MDLRTRISGVTFKNPIWVASGTFGYGEEFEDFLDLSKVGAVITKTITLKKREGNLPPRIVETPSGMLNSIGLENKGLGYFNEEYLPALERMKTKIIVSIMGSTIKEIERFAEKLPAERIDAIELNLSCPNVYHRGTSCSLIAQDAHLTEKIIRTLRRKTKCLIIAKLTPNVTSIEKIAKAAENGGTDAVSVINTVGAMAVDAEEMKPMLGNVTGGLSGPAIKPIALKAVWDVYNKVSVPVIGMGGIMTGLDVAEFMLCGASAVQVGTANLTDPIAYSRILAEFKNYLKRKKIKKINQLIGKLKVRRT